MGRTYRKRKKKQIMEEREDLCKIINLQKSLKFKCPNIKIIYFEGIGWGVKSKKKVKAGETVINLPLSHLITAGVKSEIFSIIQTDNQPPQFVLSIFLVYESHLKNNSKYHDYIEVLPKSFTNLYFCTENEIKHLPEFLKFELNKQKSLIEKNLQQLFDIINNKLCPHCDKKLNIIFTRENFLWAWFIVNTRSVYYEDKTYKNSLALAPFLDFFNHSNEAATKMSIDFERGVYVLQTLVQFEKFEQIFIKYGAHSNLKLLLEYGFILANNSNDFVEFTFEEILEAVKKFDTNSGEITKSKYNFIKLNNLNQHLTKSKEFSWNFIGLISVLLSSDQNLFFTLQSKVYSNEFTNDERNTIRKICETATERKYNEFNEQLLKMESIGKCTESFGLAKKLIKTYVNFLKIN